MIFESIKTAEFSHSATKDFVPALPEIALAGKSNVGKSSLINLLTNNFKLARTSKQPGKTRLVNYFLINKEFFLVDLPGYGYAAVSKAERERWGEMMNEYFGTSTALKAVGLLLDIRHDPTKADLQMLHYLEYYAIPYFVVATKADKIAKSKRRAAAEQLRKKLPTSFGYSIIPVSAEDGRGKDELIKAIAFFLE